MYDNRQSEENGPFDYEGNAARVRRTQQYLHGVTIEDVSNTDFGATHSDRVQIWRDALERAYPTGFWEAFNQLRARNPVGLELVIEFLEADPWFFRTGYLKERLIRYIIRFDLHYYSARLQTVVLVAVDKRYRREFRAYCRLARKVDSPDFRQNLRERLIHQNPDLRRRAQWVLDGLQNGVPKKGKKRQWHISRSSIFLAPAFLEFIVRLRSGEPERLEWAMELLEEQYLGLFKRDGLIRGKLVGALADIDLPANYRPRLRKLILSVVDTWYVYEFDRYCQLAHSIDSPGFRSKLTQRLAHSDHHIRRRAQLVLNALEKNGDP